VTVWDAVEEALSGWKSEDCLLEMHPGHGVSRASALQLLQGVSELAAQFYSWGIRKRHLVPVFLDNSIGFLQSFLALLKIEAVPLLVKMEYRCMELEEVFRNAQPQAVLTERRHLGVIQPFLGARTIVIVKSAERFSLAQSAEALPPREDIPEQIASINYTYRGYGYPLGALVAHEQYLHGARIIGEYLRPQEGEKMLVILPMAHIFTLIACVFTPLLYGLTGSITRTLNPRLLWEFIHDFQIDYITSVPEIYNLLCRLRDPAVDLSSLKGFICGGSALRDEIFERIQETFAVEPLEGYGLTEFTPVSANKRGQPRKGTVGPLGKGIECRISSTLPEGMGEIQIKAPSIMGQYYRRERESREAFQDGWFRTGDLGRLDGEHLVFLKELKETRKINGNMVDLQEVSRALRLDPQIAEAEVVLEEETLVARIAIPAGINFKEKTQQLRTSLRGILAEYKIPKRMIQI
jgi:long-subunit acyl-CoA synthetase (AMP-forming)